MSGGQNYLLPAIATSYYFSLPIILSVTHMAPRWDGQRMRRGPGPRPTDALGATRSWPRSGENYGGEGKTWENKGER